MFCPNCGNEINDDAVFCTNCGWSKSSSEVSDTKKFKIPFVPIVATVLLIAVVLIIKNCILSNIKSSELASSSTENTTVDIMETVKFGLYRQSDKYGKVSEPIEWIVLDRQEGKTLLLSKYILESKCYEYDSYNYHNNYDEYIDNLNKGVTWETCTLREWLNNTFYKYAFNSSEQEKILTTNNINSDNMEYKGGNDTKDKVFCLSLDEAEKYIYQSNIRQKIATKGTEYSKIEDEKSSKWALHVENSTGDKYNGNSPFWLRTPGAAITYDGYLATEGVDYDLAGIGVRPALWVSD